MSIKSSEITSLLRERIQSFDYHGDNQEVGSVIEVGDGIALVYGLENSMSNELIRFDKDLFGMVLNLENDHVGVVLMGSGNQVSEGDLAYRTKEVVSVGVGDALLGRVVNALGQPIDGKGPIETEKTRPIERVAPGVMTRESVNRPMHTGLKIIDSMIPIGRGQRELIIGDRQTGKTSIAVDTILNQKGQDVICVYVGIGQKASTIAQLTKRLEDEGALSYTVVVNASASEMAPMQYIAPYAGCAMAEEWMEQGKDVLIIYDDLTKHAIAYRTISLLLKRPSGREAYPGDVFYLHSRLLERSAKLNPAHGGGSMTALPIIETQAGDISAYIPTNVISITDGQLYLQTDSFNSGQRPAVDSGMSVSRVGSAAQTKAMKKVSRSIKLDLAQYQEMVSFAQFGSDVDAATQKIISRGQRLMELLKQRQGHPLPLSKMVVSLFLNHYHYLDQLAVEEILPFEKSLHHDIDRYHAEIFQEIDQKQDLSDDLIDRLHEVVGRHLQEFKDLHSDHVQ